MNSFHIHLGRKLARSSQSEPEEQQNDIKCITFTGTDHSYKPQLIQMTTKVNKNQETSASSGEMHLRTVTCFPGKLMTSEKRKKTHLTGQKHGKRT